MEGDICAICCGTEREVSVTCPLDCEYLAEARRHEKPRADQGAPLHPEIEITENFLERHELLFAAVVQHLMAAAQARPNVIDTDMREMLAAAVRTMKTSGSGLIYTTHSENAIAAGVQDEFNTRFGGWRAEVEKRGVDAGMEGPLVKDADVLKVLVFLERLAQQFDNGRPRGRGFLSVLSDWTHGFVIRPREEAAAPPPQA